jgi:hypothetical protein
MAGDTRPSAATDATVLWLLLALTARGLIGLHGSDGRGCRSSSSCSFLFNLRFVAGLELGSTMTTPDCRTGAKMTTPPILESSISSEQPTNTREDDVIGVDAYLGDCGRPSSRQGDLEAQPVQRGTLPFRLI